ncbi:MAG: PH domain-containing protein [Candidatus Magasanikbacteria bacterium]
MLDIKLKEQEKVLDEILQYGVTKIWQYLVGFLLITLAFFFMFWFFDKGLYGSIAFGFLIVLGFFIIFRNYYLWKKNVFYITTHRLIDIEQRGFFERIVSEITYDKIEDVHGKITGFWGMILRFGSVVIQTGAGQVKIVLPKVKRPLVLQQQINEVQERYLTKYSQDFRGDVANAIIDKLYELELPDLYRVKKVLDNLVSKMLKK